MTDKTGEFAARFGNEVYDDLFDALWIHLGNGKDQPPFAFVRTEMVNAANHRFHAVYTAPDGVEWDIVGRCGDFDGSVVEDFSQDALELEEREPTLYSFAPVRPLPPALFGVYLAWRKTDWFKDKERGLNLDRLNAPGVRTETHYREWAAAKGMTVATLDECEAYVKAGPLSPEVDAAIEAAAAAMAAPDAPEADDPAPGPRF